MEDPGPEIAGHKRTVELCGRGSWSEMEGPIVPSPHLLNTPRHMTGKFVPFLGAHYLASRPQLSCLIVVISSSYSTRAFFSSCADRLFWWNASGNFLPRPFFFCASKWIFYAFGFSFDRTMDSLYIAMVNRGRWKYLLASGSRGRAHVWICHPTEALPTLRISLSPTAKATWCLMVTSYQETRACQPRLILLLMRWKWKYKLHVAWVRSLISQSSRGLY